MKHRPQAIRQRTLADVFGPEIELRKESYLVDHLIPLKDPPVIKTADAWTTWAHACWLFGWAVVLLFVVGFVAGGCN